MTDTEWSLESSKYTKRLKHSSASFVFSPEMLLEDPPHVAKTAVRQHGFYRTTLWNNRMKTDKYRSNKPTGANYSSGDVWRGMASPWALECVAVTDFL